MKKKLFLPALGLALFCGLSACGDQPSDQLTSTDVTCLKIAEAGGSCSGASSSASSSTVTVSSVATVTATQSTVTTVTTVGSSTGT